jgi:hypothetical protein
MVKFDITDYLHVDEGNYLLLHEWLKTHVGCTDIHWYIKHSQSAHPWEGIGNGWKISFVIGKAFRSDRFPPSLLNWILELEDDLVAVQFKMIWPESPVIESTVTI